MKTGLFKSFAKMIGDIPDAEIYKVVELKDDMLYSLLTCKSILETPEVGKWMRF